MQHIASYPLAEDALQPHFGCAVMGVTLHGDYFCGILQSCKDGQLYFTPIQHHSVTDSHVSRARKELAKHPKVQKATRKNTPKSSAGKASLSVWGPGYRGFEFGLGAGIGFVLPLLFVGALFTFPFI